jgi:putative transposase
VAQSRIEGRDLLLGLSELKGEILAERWDPVPVRRRPHYAPEARFKILRYKHIMGLSCEETGRVFRVTGATIARWEKELSADPDKKTIGTLVRPMPPVRSYADVVREVVLSMALMGFGGSEIIADTLARAGWRLSATTVARYRKEPVPTPPAPQASGRTVQARYPNHVWMCDLTQLEGLFGVTRFRIASIFDVHSRMPLLTRTFDSEPTGEEIAALFRKAVRLHGKPRHFVSDKGSQFTSGVFTATLARLSVKHRFGAVGRHGSIALIERFWLNRKMALSRVPFMKPLLWEDLDQALHYSLVHYAVHRPHQALGGATPLEVYSGRRPAHRSAKHPPRAKPGKFVGRPPFRIGHLDPERRFPILIKAA